jgi:amino-acid N-acetyltransferase
MSTRVLRPGLKEDEPSIRALLEREGLPTSDLLAAQPVFIVACEDGRVVGVGALQQFGSAALLRSLAVAPDRRGRGLGRVLVEELERRASASGVTTLILLTESARAFFEHQGFTLIERQAVPAAAQASEEFRSLCPASATCMTKTLTTTLS